MGTQRGELRLAGEDEGVSSEENCGGRAERKPCDRWYLAYRTGEFHSPGALIQELVSAVKGNMADNGEARALLREIYGRFDLRGQAIPDELYPLREPVGAVGVDNAEMASAFVEKIVDGTPISFRNNLELPPVSPMEVCLQAIGSGFFLGKNSDGDFWMRRGVEFVNSGSVSLADFRAALRDGILKEIGRWEKMRVCSDGNAGVIDLLEKKARIGIGESMRFFGGWPFGVKVDAFDGELPPVIQDVKGAIGSVIPSQVVSTFRRDCLKNGGRLFPE
jgi:hypothetical protein